MTRQEQKYLKECKEKQFVESIKGQKIDGKTKAEFRKTDNWKKSGRILMKIKQNQVHNV